MIKKFALLSLVTLAAISARADVLARYSFDGSSRASFDTNLESIASTFDDGPGWTSMVDAARGNAAPSVFVDSTATAGTQGGAVTANTYYTFTITPVSGFQMSLSSISFDYANASTTGTFPQESFFVRSSIDGFGANLAPGVSTVTGSNGSFTTANITITGVTFQNLTTPVEFRLYVYDGSNTTGRGALVDNVTVDGTLALIPEPSTYATLLVGGGFLLGAMRMRRKVRA